MRGAPRPAGRISKRTYGFLAEEARADAAEHGAGGHLRADLELLDDDLVAREAERARRRQRAVDAAGAQELLLRAAGGQRVRARRVREQALLDRRLGGARLARSRGSASLVARLGELLARSRARRAGRCPRPRPSVGLASGLGSASMPLDLGRVDLLRLRRGVELGDLGQSPVRVRVAVRVLDLDEVAEALGDADLGHLHVADRDDRRAGVGVDREPAAVGEPLERDRSGCGPWPSGCACVTSSA